MSKMLQMKRKKTYQSVLFVLLNVVEILPISCTPTVAQVQVLLALDVHEDDAPGKPHRHHDQLRPERPPDLSAPYLFRRPLDQHAERPDDAQAGGTVEQHGTAQPAPFHAGHIQAAPL